MKFYEMLILAIEKKYGSKVDSYGKVRNFQKHLETNYEIFLSTSTLRRFFKTVPNPSSPSENTLNSLSKYLGFIGYNKFLEKSFSYDSMRSQKTFLKIKLNEIVNKDDAYFIVNELNSDALIFFIESLFNHAIIVKNVKFQRQLFKLTDQVIKTKKNHYLRESIALILWQSIALIEKDLFDKFVLTHINSTYFQQLIIFSYVDYDKLKYRYGEVIQILNTKVLSKQNKLFVLLILGFRDFLNKKSLPEINWEENSVLPEILNGRFLVYKFLFYSLKNKNSEAEIWNELIKKAKGSNNQNLFFIEVIQLLLIIKRIDLIEDVLNTFYEELFEISDGFTYLNRSIFLLSQAFVKVKKGQFKAAKDSLELIYSAIIDDDIFHLWFKVFYYIAKYSILEDYLLKLKVLEDYKKVTKQLGYLLFDIHFFENYFIED